MNKYDVNEEKIMAAVSARRDFLSALENAKCGSDLASKLGCTFSNNDLCKNLHRSIRAADTEKNRRHADCCQFPLRVFSAL